MAIQDIDLGTIPLNGEDGDVARTAFTKVNENFDDLDTRVTYIEGLDIGTVTSVNDILPVDGNVDLTPADIGAATAAQGAKADTAVQVDVFATALNQKVDKVEGYQLSQEDYTTAEKDKLASLESSLFLGVYSSLAELEAAHPTSDRPGEYAFIPSGGNIYMFVWDVVTERWVTIGTGSEAITAEQVKILYESNPNTNAFTDSDVSNLTTALTTANSANNKVDGILAGDAADKGAGAVPYNEALEYPPGSVGAAVKAGQGVQALRDDLANSTDPEKGAALVARGVVIVDDIPALMAMPRKGSQSVIVRGYHPGSKIGGGQARYWDATLSKTAHNGGTVIDPAKVFPTDWLQSADVQTWFTPSTTGSGCWVMEDNGGVYLPTEFGAKGDGVTNDHAAYNACAIAAGSGATLIFTPTTQSYRMHQFFGYDNQSVIAYGARIDLFKLSPTTGPTVLAASGNNARYEGVWLNCLEADLNNVRTSFEDRSNAHWYKCRFEGFRHVAPIDLNNGWGAYFKRAKNITLELCQFENNSQNDIAILEGSTNINIISPYGSVLNINIEPNNDSSPIRGITISNADINKLYTQENALTGNSSNSILVQSCNVQNFYYDGAGVEFENSRILNINPMLDGLGRSWGGNLILGGAIGVGSNLLKDPNLVSVSQNDPGSSWQLFTGSISPSLRYAGVNTTYGRGLRINPSNISGTASLKSEMVPVTAGSKYLMSALSGANYPIGAGFIGQNFGIRWLDSSQAQISVVTCPINRAPIPSGEATVCPVSLQSAVVVAPAGAAFAQVLIGSTLTSATTANTDWYSVGLHPIATHGSGSGMPDFYAAHTPVRGMLRGTASSIPSSSPTQYYYRDYLVGDKIINSSPAAGGFEGWLCVAAGSPGTWKAFGGIST